MLRGFPFSRPDPFTPDWPAVRLIAGETEVPARHVDSARVDPASLLKYTPELRIRLESELVQATPLQPDTSGWTAQSTDGKRLAWVTEDATTAYLSAYTIDPASPYERVHEIPQQVRRLDLRTGQWLSPLNIPGPEAPGQVVAVLPGAEQVVVLAAQFAKVTPPQQVALYRLAAFDRASGHCQWSQELPTTGSRPGLRVGLWGVPGPNYAADEVRHLSWMGDALAVSTGPRDAITCLEASTGQVRWSVERIWEFTRGFTGPSVWSHHLGRFGEYPPHPFANAGDAGENDEERRQAFNEQYTCAIVGGPLVLPYGSGAVDDWRCKDGGYRIFVAVSRASVSQWEGFLAKCLVYELNERGEPIALVHLPRMVYGSQTQVHAGGLDWVCQDAGVLRLLPSRHSDAAHTFPGSPNLLANVEWYRQLPSSRPDAWLRTGPAGDPHTFVQGYLARTAGGGYLANEDEGVYRFPLVLMDAATSESRPLTLVVPYRGKVPHPRTNCGRYTGPDGKERIETAGPWVLGVTGLEGRGTHLTIILGQEHEVTRLEFDLDPLLSPR